MRGPHAYAELQYFLGRHAGGAALAVKQLAIAVSVGLADGIEKGVELGPCDIALRDRGDQFLLRVDLPMKCHYGCNLGSRGGKEPVPTSKYPKIVRLRKRPVQPVNGPIFAAAKAGRAWIAAHQAATRGCFAAVISSGAISSSRRFTNGTAPMSANE